MIYKVNALRSPHPHWACLQNLSNFVFTCKKLSVWHILHTRESCRWKKHLHWWCMHPLGDLGARLLSCELQLTVCLSCQPSLLKPKTLNVVDVSSLRFLQDHQQCNPPNYKLNCCSEFWRSDDGDELNTDFTYITARALSFARFTRIKVPISV